MKKHISNKLAVKAISRYMQLFSISLALLVITGCKKNHGITPDTGNTVLQKKSNIQVDAIRNVSNNTELTSAMAAAVAGDVIVLADGTYAGFTVTKSNITIQAATKGGANITSGIIRLSTVSNVNLLGLRITTPGSAQTIDGEAFKTAVWFEATTACRLAGSYLKLSGQSSVTDWVMLSGNSNNNRIDHNEFGPNTVNGHFIFVRGNRTGISVPTDRTSWANGSGPNNPNMARHTTIDSNYFHDQTPDTHASICLGGIGLAGDYQNTFSVVQNNLFVNCDGDAEIIEIKSSSNTIRHNTIRTSIGTLSLRSGNNSTVADNLMLQEGKAGTGGIKIYEKDHTITGNYIDNTNDYPLVLGAGDAYTNPSFGHAQVFRANVSGNTFINIATRPVIIGHGGDGTVSPVDCHFDNNNLRGTVSPLIDKRRPGNTTFVGNTESGSTPPLPYTPLTTSDAGPSAYTLPTTGGGGGGTLSGFFRITPRHSGKALAVQGSSTANNAAVVQFTYGGSSTNDEWELINIGSNFYKIMNRNSGKAMVVQSASTADGALVIQYTYGGSATNDEWGIVDDGGGYYHILNRNSGKALEVAGSSTADGAAVDQLTYSSGNNQQFQLVSIP